MWIAGIALGHNAGVCLLKNGEVVFSIEEERLSRAKHDGGPLLSMMKILDYTDKIDYLVVSNLTTNPNDPRQHTVLEYTREPLYQGLARRLGLIEQADGELDTQSPQVVNMFDNHHRLHSTIAFYNSGFETAVSVIVDSSGSSREFGSDKESNIYFEIETIFDCSYTKGIKTLYKKMGCDKGRSYYIKEMHDEQLDEKFELVADEGAGIGKVWDAVTDYCGFHINDAGKTMGLSAFGSSNDKIPDLFRGDTSNKDLTKAQYPYRTSLNIGKEEFEFLDDMDWKDDLSKSNLRRDMAYAVQKETQEQVLNLIIKASEMSGNKNVVLSGGYALNCVSNYHYLNKLNDLGINLYVEPNSSDAGTATGAALLYHYMLEKEKGNEWLMPRERRDNLFLGPEYNYNIEDVRKTVEKYNAELLIADRKDVAKLLKDGEIISIFQGRSENGPRALGNRSILFNPTIENGKDIVNKVKGREYFRPFAGAILKEWVHDWFDMRGLEESPNMMYAVDVLENKRDLIPSVLHVDNTCRIQTVTETQNRYLYKLIEEFYRMTTVPVLFNTSFNLAGEPLVETLDDALKVLKASELEYCYMPELGSLIHLENVK
tara:strand:- start:14115 stop:15914 length:1800 start_codon:yes stop_codon:yes gene_type:complete